MRLNLIIFLALGASLLIQSCAKDDTSQYLRRDEMYKKEGSFKVSITGTTENGYLLNESLDLGASTGSNKLEEKDSIITFSVYQGSDNIGSRNTISLTLKYNTHSKKVTEPSGSLRFMKIIDSKSMIEISEDFYNINYNSGYSYYNYVPEVVLTNFVYDSATNYIKGNIVLTKVYEISTNLKRTMIIKGEFNVHVLKDVS